MGHESAEHFPAGWSSLIDQTDKLFFWQNRISNLSTCRVAGLFSLTAMMKDTQTLKCLSGPEPQ